MAVRTIGDYSGRSVLANTHMDASSPPKGRGIKRRRSSMNLGGDIYSQYPYGTEQYSVIPPSYDTDSSVFGENVTENIVVVPPKTKAKTVKKKTSIVDGFIDDMMAFSGLASPKTTVKKRKKEPPSSDTESEEKPKKKTKVKVPAADATPPITAPRDNAESKKIKRQRLAALTADGSDKAKARKRPANTSGATTSILQKRVAEEYPSTGDARAGQKARPAKKKTLGNSSSGMSPGSLPGVASSMPPSSGPNPGSDANTPKAPKTKKAKVPQTPPAEGGMGQAPTLEAVPKKGGKMASTKRVANADKAPIDGGTSVTEPKVTVKARAPKKKAIATTAPTSSVTPIPPAKGVKPPMKPEKPATVKLRTQDQDSVLKRKEPAKVDKQKKKVSATASAPSAEPPEASPKKGKGVKAKKPKTNETEGTSPAAAKPAKDAVPKKKGKKPEAGDAAGSPDKASTPVGAKAAVKKAKPGAKAATKTQTPTAAPKTPRAATATKGEDGGPPKEKLEKAKKPDASVTGAVVPTPGGDEKQKEKPKKPKAAGASDATAAAAAAGVGAVAGAGAAAAVAGAADMPPGEPPQAAPSPQGDISPPEATPPAPIGPQADTPTPDGPPASSTLPLSTPLPQTTDPESGTQLSAGPAADQDMHQQPEAQTSWQDGGGPGSGPGSWGGPAPEEEEDSDGDDDQTIDEYYDAHGPHWGDQTGSTTDWVMDGSDDWHVVEHGGVGGNGSAHMPSSGI